MACELQIATPVGQIGELPYAIGSGYGWRMHPIENVRLFHFGIDIPAPEGELVRAAGDGIVIQSYLSSSAGNTIKIEHPNGYVTVYMHMLNRLVEKGTTVKAGEVIGTVGSTGNVTGPHLHFEIRSPGGSSVDPTDCYNNSQYVNPYQSDAGGIPNWVWWTGGGILALLAGTIIVQELNKP